MPDNIYNHLPPARNINVSVTVELGPHTLSLLGVIKNLPKMGEVIISNQEKIMATLDQVDADEQAVSAQIVAVSSVISNLQAQIAALGLNPEDQAKLDKIFNEAEANKAALAGLIPAAPAPTTPAA